jgi:methionine synthase II (cobalamin-independent)
MTSYKRNVIRTVEKGEITKEQFYEIINSNGVRAQEAQDPIQIAKVRYAKGEITKEQYYEIMKDLNNLEANGA